MYALVWFFFLFNSSEKDSTPYLMPVLWLVPRLSVYIGLIGNLPIYQE